MSLASVKRVIFWEIFSCWESTCIYTRIVYRSIHLAGLECSRLLLSFKHYPDCIGLPRCPTSSYYVSYELSIHQVSCLYRPCFSIVSRKVEASSAVIEVSLAVKTSSRACRTPLGMFPEEPQT